MYKNIPLRSLALRSAALSWMAESCAIQWISQESILYKVGVQARVRHLVEAK